MNVFIAGGSGAIGRQLVPMLVEAGHHVVAMTRSPEGAALLDSMGAAAVIGNVFDEVRLDQLVERAEPEVVIHQLTAFGTTDGDPFAETIRVREQGTRNLVAAARRAKARRFVAQSISFICAPTEEGLTDEETPLYLDAPHEAIRRLARSVSELEHRTVHCGSMDGVVLRYGWFYGPGTDYDPAGAIPRAIKKGRMSIVGGGDGTYSFIHVRDAAVATTRALTCGAPGIYNIVDDAPARLGDWLPVAAKLLGAPAPGHLSADAAREKLGDMLVYVFNEQSGASNRKARKVLGWEPSISSWRTGFEELYATT